MSAPFLLALRAGLALSLYAFLGWALLMLWRSLQEQGEILATYKVPPIRLSITQESGQSATKHFTQPEITLGRNPHCELRLESETVSAYHARLNYHHGQWWLEDLKSSNGTTLNAERIDSPTVIISGDEIACGEATVSVRLARDEISPPTQQIND